MNAILKKLSDTIDVTESTPLYIQVANAIREKIMNGELKEGANLAPEYELADDLNVSLITTKKALDILVKEKLIYRRPRLGTFVGNIKNRILITDTHKILFLFCNARIPDQYSSLLFSGVEQACKENNFSLKLLKYMQGDKLLEKILKEKYTGILVSGLVYPEIILKLNKQQSPFVVIGYIGTQWKGEEELYQILPPAEEYGKIATDYLIKNNHRKIVLITGPLTLTYYKKIKEGFQTSLQRHGIKSKKQSVFYTDTLESREKEGYHLASKILEDIKPTAILCVNDLLALGAIKKIKELGLNIPNDISIISIGNLPSSQFIHPGLTSVDFNIFETGKMAVEFLKDIIMGQIREKKLIFEKCRLIERETVQKI